MKRAGPAGVLAALLLVPACGDDPDPKARDSVEPLRRATFRALAARDFLKTCPAGRNGSEYRQQTERFEELKQLAQAKRAGHALWLGGNDWAGVARYSDREPCEDGDEAFRQALAAFSATLDTLAGRIAAYPG